VLGKSGSAELFFALITVWESQSNVAFGFRAKSKDHRFARNSFQIDLFISDPCGQTPGENVSLHSNQHEKATHNPDTGNPGRTLHPEGPQLDRGAYR
jgi:hypothetical protein